MNENFIEESQKVVNCSRVLVIGSGGIGCELLKSLVVSGFKQITLIDLDQIEKSNLNRQFLFSKNDVGKNKSEMAAKNIMVMRPDDGIKIDWHVGNIKDTNRFGTDFFSQFNIVMNALDNIDARTHVNKLCHMLDIPLVNSGSEGYLGNVQTSLKNRTPCYNCLAKNNTKSIPICTLRSKPEKIEHCVAWAKNLFELLYTGSDSSSFLLDEKLSENNFENLMRFFYYNLREEKLVNEMIIPINLETVFNSEVIKHWDYVKINEGIHVVDNEKLGTDFIVYFLIESSRSLDNRVEKVGKFEKFDKEDQDHVNFVFAASNLRALNFQIPIQTRFKVKEIAGNIVPAIASTNAIVASLQTIEAIKVLMRKDTLLKNLHYSKTKEVKSSTAINEDRNPDCIVCGREEKFIFLRINCLLNTFRFFVDEVCKKQLNLKFPIISLSKELLYDELEAQEDEEDSKVLLDKTLNQLVKNNSILQITEDGRAGVFQLIINDVDTLLVEETEIIFSKENPENKSNVENSSGNDGSKVGGEHQDVVLPEITSDQKERVGGDKGKNKGVNLIYLDQNEGSSIDLISDDERSLGRKRKHDTEEL